ADHAVLAQRLVLLPDRDNVRARLPAENGEKRRRDSVFAELDELLGFRRRDRSGGWSRGRERGACRSGTFGRRDRGCSGRLVRGLLGGFAPTHAFRGRDERTLIARDSAHLEALDVVGKITVREANQLQ